MNPDFPAFFADARALDRSGQKELALQAYVRGLEVLPDDAGAWAEYAGLLMDLDRWVEAEEACAKALRFDAKHYVGLVHSACILIHQEHPSAAKPLLVQAVAQDPKRLGARLTLSDCLVALGELTEARAVLDSISKDFPGNPVAMGRLSSLYVLQGAWGDLRLDMERQGSTLTGPEAAYRQSHVELLFGDLPAAWDHFESRLQLPERAAFARRFPQPRWTGEAFAGKTLLLHWEQGFGDTLMFLRYAPLVKRLGGRVLVQVQPHLADLVATCPGLDEVIADGAPLPPFDLQAPLMSLPFIFQTDLASIPAEVPYLDLPGAVPNRDWISEALIPSIGRLRIGVAWAGKANHQRDAKRSMPVQALAPLAEWEGVAWHSFQMGTAELPPLPGIVSLAPLLSNFSDTAYALSGMDLVITVDTALAHLAGAMGVPTCLLVSFIPDWRWLMGRDDSPWYPSLRLFRQAKPGDWDTAIQHLIAYLNQSA